MTSTLSGRTAVITGGARGIGLTLARALAAEGAGVALLDLLDTVDDAANRSPASSTSRLTPSGST